MDKVGELDLSRTYWSVAMATVQEEAVPVPRNNGLRYKFDEEADLRLLKCVSLHGAHIAERGQTTALFVDVAA